MPKGDVVTFVVDGERVRVTGEGVLSIEDARECWADLVKLGAHRDECRDEDGHDHEDCTCPPEIDWAAEAERHEEYDRKNFEGRWDPIHQEAAA